jgi:retron-type reverse transcriptase
VDAMSLEKIGAIIGLLRQERYRWTPVRRTYIPKKSGKLRPLGIPTWSDKLLQEVIRPTFRIRLQGISANYPAPWRISR